jgi:hypothetical protein
MLFGSTVDFTNISEATLQWSGIADEIEEVQYTENARGRGRMRRRVTNTVKLFIARLQRFKSKAKGTEDEPAWMVLADEVEHEYNGMLECKNVLNQNLDNVW